MRVASAVRGFSFALPASALSTARYASLATHQGAVHVPLATHDVAWCETQIDGNLSLVNLARTCIAAFGLTAGLGALASEEGARARLQCALSAASCLMTSVFYVRMTSVRTTPGRGYSAQGNASVDSMRFSNWVVCNALQAWLALLMRGPFQDDARFVGYTYRDWFVLGTVLCSAGVLLGGVALFCVEHAASSDSTRRRLAFGGCAGLATIGAVACAVFTSLAFHYPADTHRRTQHEIDMGMFISSFWALYPMTGGLRVALSILVAWRAAHGAEPPGYLFGALDRLGGALVCCFRAASMSHASGPANCDETLGRPAVPPLCMQMLDTVLALVDVAVVAMPALVATTLAFPTRG